MSRASTASSLHVGVGEKRTEEMEESFGSVRTLKIRGATFGPLVSVAYCSLYKCLYVSDADKHRVCKVAPSTGLSIVLAGYGEKGYEDGYRGEARFHTPRGLAVDPRNGDIFVADMWNHRIRKITPRGVVTTVAGSGKCGFQNGSISIPDDAGTSADAGTTSTSTGAGTSTGTSAGTSTGAHPDKADADTKASDAKAPKPVSFAYPYSVALNSLGEIFVADAGNLCIRVIAPEANGHRWREVSKLAGCRQKGAQNGPALRAQFSYPAGMTMGAPGTRELYIADEENHCVRRINEQGDMVETYAHACNARGCTKCAGRRSTTTPAGRRSAATGRTSRGSTGSTATSNHLDDDDYCNDYSHPSDGTQNFHNPLDLARGSDGTIYVADRSHNRICMIDPDDRSVGTLAGTGEVCARDGPRDAAAFQNPSAITVNTDDGRLYVNGGESNTIRVIDIKHLEYSHEAQKQRGRDGNEVNEIMHTSITFQRGKSCCEQDREKENTRPPLIPLFRKGQSYESFDSRAKRVEKGSEEAFGDAIAGSRDRVRLWTN